MSDYDRGPYTPSSEPPLAFDPRRLNPPRRGGPTPVVLIVSVLMLALVVGGGFFLYRGGARTPGAPPQPVGAPIGDVRMAPPPQAQPQDPAAGLSVYRDDPNASPVTPAFVPPPEQPTPRPAANAVAPIAPPVQAPVRPAPVTTVVVASPPAAVAPHAPKPLTIASIAQSAETHAAPPAREGSAVVQIGAFSSAALADAGWNQDAAVAPGVMAGKNKRVDVMKRNGTTLYRAAITGFTSRFEAQALCDRLKAAGKTCFVR
ncbi:MAG TPA: SPOR domain-containing protein [Caulobacteraceae bacterium]